MEASILSDQGILEHLDKGTVVIEPFNMENLSTSSYDVTLGETYYRASKETRTGWFYNMYDQAHVGAVWGPPQSAQTWSKLREKRYLPCFKNIAEDDKIILIGPGESILAHTQEIIGGRKTVTTMMKARSSIGRSFLTVCSCAGWGDIGYVKHWTMEIRNHHQTHTIPLVVGRRIAQIIFMDTHRTETKTSYEKRGKYCPSRPWTSSDMLPKLYLDREIQ